MPGGTDNQEDRQALLQSWKTRQEGAIHTESWLLTRRLRTLFEEAWDGQKVLVRDRKHVAEALRYRLGKL